MQYSLCSDAALLSKRSIALSLSSILLVSAIGILLVPANSSASGQQQPVNGAVSAVNASNQFAMDFYSNLTNGGEAGNASESNIFFSPWSISNAFAIAYEGARGPMAEEMQSVFHLSSNENASRSSFMEANNKLNEKSANYTLRSANALWIQEGFGILPEYVDVAEQYYDSKVDNVNFASPEAANTINDWVATKTNNTIDELFPPDSADPDRRLAITNAIYFKGKWLNPFDGNNTTEEDFRISNDSVVKVPMMKSDESQFLNYTESRDLQILEMPYEGRKISMLVLLPRDNSSLESLEESLTLENLTRWKSSLSTEHIEAVHMPKFTLKTEYHLVEMLTQLGMPSAFIPGTADFTGITGNKDLFIDAAIHKAFVDVNEEGTEAAAATAVSMVSSAPAPPVYRFIADHPFVFIIQENETGNILFMGRVVEPPVE